MIVGIIGFIISLIKLYIDYVLLRKDYREHKDRFVLFKENIWADVEKCQIDIREQANFKGVDLKELKASVDNLVKSNIEMQSSMGHLSKYIDELRTRIK